MYHGVGEVRPPHLKHLSCWRDLTAFKCDLDLFLRHYTPVGLDDVLAYAAQGRTLPANAIHLTVDDGLREAAEVIAPIRFKRGIPATFFLTTGFVDNQILGYRHLASLLIERIAAMSATRRENLDGPLGELFRSHGVALSGGNEAILRVDYSQRGLLCEIATLIELDVDDYLRTERPYVSRDDVRALIAQGFSVGAHSIDHPPFGSVPAEEQHRQAAESLTTIADWFAPPRRVFAFPFSTDGVEPEFYDRIDRDRKVDLFFGTGWRLHQPTRQVVDRIPMDSCSSRSASAILKEVYSRNWVSRIRSRLSRQPPARGHTGNSIAVDPTEAKESDSFDLVSQVK